MNLLLSGQAWSCGARPAKSYRATCARRSLPGFTIIRLNDQPYASLQERRYQLSVASLAREADVARNAIYTNHRAMIDALRQAVQQRVVPSKLESWEDKLAQQRAVIDVLKTEQRRLVTENAALLKRAINAEAAGARHQRQNARLLQQADQGRRPVKLVPRPSKA